MSRFAPLHPTLAARSPLAARLAARLCPRNPDSAGVSDDEDGGVLVADEGTHTKWRSTAAAVEAWLDGGGGDYSSFCESVAAVEVVDDDDED